MKNDDETPDTKRSKFLIKAMFVQIIVVLIIMFCYWAFLRS